MAQEIEQLNRESLQAEYEFLFGDNYTFFHPSDVYEQVHGESKLFRVGESEDLYYPSKRPVVEDEKGINWLKVLGYGTIVAGVVAFAGGAKYLRWGDRKKKRGKKK